jgi:hypothetical protein
MNINKLIYELIPHDRPTKWEDTLIRHHVWIHKQPVHGWYLGRMDGKLDHGDDRQTCVGETLTHTGALYVRFRGLHVARRLIDCLGQTVGFRIWRVRCTGEIQELPYELAARNRTALWSIDARDILLGFARRCALESSWFWPLRLPESVDRFLQGATDADTITEAPEAWPQPSVLNGCMVMEASGVEVPLLKSPQVVDNALGTLAWVETSIHSALRAHEVAEHHERAAGWWIAMAYLSRFDVARSLLPTRHVDIIHNLNEKLEQEVWQRAYDLEITTPEAERDWQLSQIGKRKI